MSNNGYNKTETNLFPNRFQQNRNNKVSDIFGVKQLQTQTSTMSNGGKLNKKNVNSDEIEKIPNKQNIYIKPDLKSQLDICVTENNNNNMNLSFDAKLNKTQNNKDKSEVTFGKFATKKKRNASMENIPINLEKLICNNCLNSQLITVKNLNNNFDKNENFSDKIDENYNFIVIFFLAI